MIGKQEISQSYLQIVCFRIGSEEYGVDILQVQEILKLPKITKLPKTLEHVLGVIDLRGRVIPIVDLSSKFGIERAKSTGTRRAVVVDISGKQVGLAIDSVSHVIRVNSSDIEPPPPVVKGISGKYISGIAKLEEGFVVILDIKQIFSVSEINALKNQ